MASEEVASQAKTWHSLCNTVNQLSVSDDFLKAHLAGSMHVRNEMQDITFYVFQDASIIYLNRLNKCCEPLLWDHIDLLSVEVLTELDYVSNAFIVLMRGTKIRCLHEYRSALSSLKWNVLELANSPEHVLDFDTQSNSQPHFV